VTPRSTPRDSLAANLALALGALLFSLVLVEIGCQLVARLVIFPGWARDMQSPRIFSPIRGSVLAYELAPELGGRAMDGKQLRITVWLRADSVTCSSVDPSSRCSATR
jgi:hypothetical protein